MGANGKDIAIFSAFYAPHMGGVEQYTAGLAKGLAECGCAVTVVTCNTVGAAPVEADPAGFEVLRLPSISLMDRMPFLRPGFRTSLPWRRLDLRSFDAVIVNTRFYPLSLVGARFACERGLTPIVIEHGSGPLSLGNALTDAVLGHYEQAITQQVKACNPRFYGVSWRASAWLETFGITSAGEIPNTIDASAFRASASMRDFRRELGLNPEAVLAAFTGRMIEEKGIGVLAHAAQMLFDRDCPIQIIAAGDGPEAARIGRTAPPNMHMVGRLDRPDIAALLTQADMFCFPSTYPEGLPTSLLEAAACACFVITGPVAGVDEVVPDPRCGIVLERSDAVELCAAMEMAFEDPAYRRQAAAECCKHVEQNLNGKAATQAALHACGLA